MESPIREGAYEHSAWHKEASKYMAFVEFNMVKGSGSESYYPLWVGIWEGGICGLGQGTCGSVLAHCWTPTPVL